MFQGSVKCSFNENGEVVGGDFVEEVPITSEGNVRGGEGDVRRGALDVYVERFPCGYCGVIKDSVTLVVVEW